MEKIFEALKNLLPADQIKDVTSAIDDLMAEHKETLQKEYDSNLEEAYSDLSSQLAEKEKIAETGYQEAYAIIDELRHRLETQGEEYKAELEKGWAQAYAKIKEEQAKNSTLELEMYEEYDKKLNEMKEYMVDKVDQFLQFKGADIYEQAKRDILNDPRMAEHRVALEKIVDITSNFVSDDNFNAVNSAKLEESTRAIEELKGNLRLMEARNIRLSNDNTKLNESVRQAKELLTEQKKTTVADKKAEVLTEQQERTKKAQNITGKGTIAGTETVVIAESSDAPANSDWLVLSGLKSAD